MFQFRNVLYLSVYPNASLPGYKDGKLFYENRPNYFKEQALNFREQGISLIGGCCGTTPEHIRALAEGLVNRKPVQEKSVKKNASKVKVSERERAEKTKPTGNCERETFDYC